MLVAAAHTGRMGSRCFRSILLVACLVLLTVGSGALAPLDAAAAGCDTAGQPTTTIYLPNITKTLGGPDGWVTPFIVQNIGTAATTLEVSFYRFGDGALMACRKIGGLQPYTSFADVPNNDADLPGDSQFAVVVRSFGAQVVAVVNEHQNEHSATRAEALSYTGFSAGATSTYLPFIAKPTPAPCPAVPQTELTCNLRWLTTFIMQNLGTAVATVTARFQSYDGAVTATLTRTITPGRSQFIDPSVEPGLTAGRYYAVTLTSTQPVGAIVNAHDDAPTQTAPRAFSYNGVAQPTAGDIFVPYVRRDGGAARSLPGGVAIQNAGPSDATPTLTFQRLGGAGPVSISAPAPIKPGAAWHFDPEIYASVGGYQLCAAAGPGRCIDLGEHSLVVSGGTFAVVSAVLAPGNAMGFSGAPAETNRAFVPNVTRTLGGPSGWTTPIVLQSNGATGAVLRWYRFADGALILRQTVGPLSRGASLRIDPRSVAGLADNTQYAVVVDAQNGNLAAIVTELTFTGGDGTMAYEGFGQTVSSTPQPIVVSVAPAKGSVSLDGTVQFTAVVKDQFDTPMPSTPVFWSVAPTTLGTINANGQFTASASVTGNGTITATTGGATGTAQITVVPPTVATVGGISFRVDSSGPADVYTETGISPTDVSKIVAQVAVDVAAIQTTYGRSFATRPRLYVMATTASFTTSIQTIFGWSPTEAQRLGTAALGFYATAQHATATDWQKVLALPPPLSNLRHELTHMMEGEISRGFDFPAWFDEGNARLEDLTVPGSAYKVMTNRFGAASMAGTGTLWPLADLVSQETWNARPSPFGTYQYYEASQAVQLLRTDIGTAGVIRILEALGRGQTFDAAYATVSGQPLSTFYATVSQRIRAISPTYPGITTATDTPEGAGMAIMLYGFPANAQVTLTVGGAASSVPRSVTVSAIGTYVTYLNAGWPAGSYTITATWSGGTVSASSSKATSMVDERIPALDAGAVLFLTLPEMDIATLE
jgi:hypothetical protein